MNEYTHLYAMLYGLNTLSCFFPCSYPVSKSSDTVHEDTLGL